MHGTGESRLAPESDGDGFGQIGHADEQPAGTDLGLVQQAEAVAAFDVVDRFDDGPERGGMAFRVPFLPGSTGGRTDRGILPHQYLSR